MRVRVEVWSSAWRPCDPLQSAWSPRPVTRESERERGADVSGLTALPTSPPGARSQWPTRG
eukprot:2685700-Prymnesium_polylepis.1